MKHHISMLLLSDYNRAEAIDKIVAAGGRIVTFDESDPSCPTVIVEVDDKTVGQRVLEAMGYAIDHYQAAVKYAKEYLKANPFPTEEAVAF